MISLRPLFDRILVAPIDDESPQTRSGLLIPQIALGKRAYHYGEVLAVGPGRTDEHGVTVPVRVKVGEVIAYPRSAGVPFPILDDKGAEQVVMVMREPEALAIVEGLERASSIVGLDGALLRMRPQSLARPDAAYENIDAHERAVHDLRDAPPDVRAELDYGPDDPS